MHWIYTIPCFWAYPTHRLRGRTGTLMLKVDNEVDNYVRTTLCAYWCRDHLESYTLLMTKFMDRGLHHYKTCTQFVNNIMLLVEVHDIIQPCGLVPWSWNMSIIFPWALEEIGDICLLFVHRGLTWKVGWSFTLGTMHRNYYSS